MNELEKIAQKINDDEVAFRQFVNRAMKAGPPLEEWERRRRAQSIDDSI
tara:strand:- start:15442 stop:15588 length:147 start_codon:yes stop_codon:yes gene_type:complete